MLWGMGLLVLLQSEGWGVLIRYMITLRSHGSLQHSQATFLRGQTSELASPQGQATLGNSIWAPSPISTWPRRPRMGCSCNLATPSPRKACDLLPPLSCPCVLISLPGLGVGVKGGDGDGRWNLASLSQSLKVKYLISSPNVRLLRHSDRDTCVSSVPPPGAHYQSVFRTDFVLTLWI